MTQTLKTPVSSAQPTPPPSRKRGRDRVSILFAVPCLALFTGVIVVPTVTGVGYAFTDWSGVGSAINFNGLTNFIELARSSEARTALFNTIFMAAFITVLQNVIGMALALGLNSRIKSRNILRTLLFAPVVMTPIVIGYLWQFLFLPGGAVSRLFGLFGFPDVNVLGDPDLARWGVIVVFVWQFSGYSMVIYLAGLQNIPQEISEAAAIDGATSWQRFVWITLPLLRTPIAISMTLAVISSLKLFDQVIATTQGGPGYTTETLSLMLYNQAFLNNRYGYAIALGLAVFVLIAVVTFLQLRLFREKD